MVADHRVFARLNHKVDDLNFGVFLLPDFVNAFGIVCQNPIAHKTGRHADIHDAVGIGTDGKRLQPAVKSFFADFRF